MPDEPPRTVAITVDASVYGARQAARELALSVGFDRRRAEELVLVASELASNILKHAGKGELRLQVVRDSKRGVGLEMIASDQGPPIPDFQEALRDGWSQGGPIDPLRLFGRKGIGAGLGAVRRFSDELRYNQDARGKQISATRYLSPLPPR